MTLCIRADASDTIGIGHVMRCVAIAYEAVADGIQVEFLTHKIDDALGRFLKEQGFGVREIRSAPGTIEDVEETLRLIQESNCRFLIVDGYQFAEAYCQKLEAIDAKTIFIDDSWGNPPMVPTILINQNLWASESIYHSINGNVRFLLGSRYTLLRREFKRWMNWRREPRAQIEQLLVNMGGSDPLNNLGLVLKQLNRCPLKHLTVTVVAGVHCRELESLNSLSRELPFTINILEHSDDMPAIMAKADAAISGAGFTTFELAFMGVPSLVLLNHHLQVPNIEKLEEFELARRVRSFSDIPELLSGLSSNFQFRSRVVEVGRHLFDGHGASRTWKAILYN